MQTILTIDFDIIMGPSIDLYNARVPFTSWTDLATNPHYQILVADNIHYLRLTSLLIELIHFIPKENVRFIESHDDICKFITEKSNIINIDHHHDLGYENKEDNEKLTCANWVKYLSDQNLLEKYVWLHNTNSLMPEKNSELISANGPLQDIEDLNSYIANIDFLVLCLSEPWVPPSIRPLFDVWIEIFNLYYKADFKIEYKLF